LFDSLRPDAPEFEVFSVLLVDFGRVFLSWLEKDRGQLELEENGFCGCYRSVWRDKSGYGDKPNDLANGGLFGL